MNKTYVGEGKVVLIAGGGKTYSDVAAIFCRAEKSLDELLTDPDTKKIISHLVKSGHHAALEFDQFIFGIEGYARVTEVELVRKRLASYMIKSGRPNKHGKRSFDIVIPEAIETVHAMGEIDPAKVMICQNSNSEGSIYLLDLLHKNGIHESEWTLKYYYSTNDLLDMMERWYNSGVKAGYKEEELRYLKPQATEFKAVIRMDAANLRNWFKIRMCNRAQTEIRDLATKIHKLASEAAPELFEGSGPSCVELGYCPEVEQCAQCKGKIPTKNDIKKLINEHWKK